MKEYLKDNKKVLIFTIIANFIIITLLLINLISLFKNLFNTPSSLIENEFKVKSQNLGCQLIDKTKDNTYDGVKTYLISDENSCPYKMSYITFNKDNIKNFYFEQLTKDVLNNGGVITGDVNISLNGFHEYLTTGEYYKFVVLNNDNNNLYYVSTEQANKKLVNKEFKKYLYNVNFKSFKYIPYILSIYGLILLISLWGILKKAYNKGWYAVIPFYNLYKLFQATMGNGWYFIIALIPVVNIAMFIILNSHLCKAFNKTENTSILAFLLPAIIWPFIGFDKSEYTKPEKKPKVVPEKRVPSPVKKVSGVSKFIKWFITVILILLSLTLIEVFREEKLMGYLILSFIIFIFSLLICPLITSYTQKYDKYTKYKWLVVLILFIILFSIFLFMEF